MRFWHENVDDIIKFNRKALLTGKGSVSNAQMEAYVERVYDRFDKNRKARELAEADEADIREIEMLENEIQTLKKSSRK